jgi:hypothetical protein
MVGLVLLAVVPFGLADKAKDAPPKKEEAKKDKQVVSTKPTKYVPATSINFKKAYKLPFHSLGTLGARIEAARRRPDPVALAHTASELAIAEKVSGQKASLTSKQLLAESAELARMRRQVAELKATFALHQQIAKEATDEAYWAKQIAIANQTAKAETAAVLRNELPSGAPRKVLLNNYTTQYIDLYVNGNYKIQVLPGASSWCVIEHKWSPTILKAYGDQDVDIWGPRTIYGTFQTYTWNIQTE